VRGGRVQGQEMAKHIARGVNFCVVSKVPIVFESTGIREQGTNPREKRHTSHPAKDGICAPSRNFNHNDRPRDNSKS
jgi:hypothetical protein